MIIWIASYPKSGNTWVRSLLTSYYFSKINSQFPDLNKIPNFNVGDFVNNSKLLKNNLDVSAHWLKVQNLINVKYNKTIFFKTHNACVSINNNNFTNSDHSRGCIYVVRDPRNVITSYKNYESKSYEEILKHMKNKDAFLTSNKKFEDKFGFKGFDWRFLIGNKFSYLIEKLNKKTYEIPYKGNSHLMILGNNFQYKENHIRNLFFRIYNLNFLIKYNYLLLVRIIKFFVKKLIFR